MRLLIDGDACPNKEEIIQIAMAHHCEVLLLTDYAHQIQLDNCQTIYCEVGNDSVDLQLIKRVQAKDVVITQDYGLASLVLARGAKVLHVSGKVISDDNIQTLLMTRYISAKQRRAGVRTKGPTKRTKEDKQFFLQQLGKLLSE